MGQNLAFVQENDRSVQEIRDIAAQQDKEDRLESSQNLSASGEEVSGSAEEMTATLHDQSAIVQRLSEMVRTIEQLTKEQAGLLPDNQ